MARIVGAFGVQGWIKVKTFTAEPGGLARHDRWLVGKGGEWREMALEGFEVHSRGPVAKLAGCDDREAADALRGAEIAVSRAALGEAGEGEIYWADLVGLDVVDTEGNVLGKVEGLFESGETSVLTIGGARERLIPFVPDYVKAVDLEAKRITVDWKADYDA